MEKVRLIFLVLTVAMLTSNCESDTPGLVNKWKLVASLYDPGDGSGKFQPVDSGETIEFYEDETFETNAYGCLLAADGRAFSGSYSIEEGTLMLDDCESTETFELSEESLIVSLQCFEPCRLKFKLIR